MIELYKIILFILPVVLSCDQDKLGLGNFNIDQLLNEKSLFSTNYDDLSSPYTSSNIKETVNDLPPVQTSFPVSSTDEVTSQPAVEASPMVHDWVPQHQQLEQKSQHSLPILDQIKYSKKYSSRVPIISGQEQSHQYSTPPCSSSSPIPYGSI